MANPVEPKHKRDHRRIHPVHIRAEAAGCLERDDDRRDDCATARRIDRNVHAQALIARCNGQVFSDEPLA